VEARRKKLHSLQLCISYYTIFLQYCEMISHLKSDSQKNTNPGERQNYNL